MSDLYLDIAPSDEYGFLISTKEAARGFDCSPHTIRNTKNSNKSKFAEGVHFVKLFNNVKDSKGQVTNLSSKQTFWTREGVILLSSLIDTERAREFAGWAKEVIIDPWEYEMEDEDELLTVVDLPSMKKSAPDEASPGKLTVEGIAYIRPALKGEKKPRKLYKKNDVKLLMDRIRGALDFELAKGSLSKALPPAAYLQEPGKLSSEPLYELETVFAFMRDSIEAHKSELIPLVR
jgi:hypothetical protein